ncbi:MAG: type I polyketide synthase, partial [Chitinophagales bacterium]
MSDQEKYKQQIKDALTAIQKLKQQLKKEQEKNNQSIAIVGVALRLPGNVNSMQDYWQLLLNNIDAIEDIPNSRFNTNELYSDKNDIGKINIKQGGYLNNIDLFDGNYFDISRVELESLDPQQRLLLELSVEALENAGININSLNNSATGVFTGITNVDYQEKHFRSGNYQLVNPYSYSGSAYCATSGRISYLLGLQGPSVAIDTACSSSLVATHLACQSLRNNECDLALVGAANLILEPELTMYFSHLNALSATSRCQPFSNDANGFIRSEGAAVIILKRLNDAVQHKDNILATIKGSAVNQDGRSNGFTAPSVLAQTKLHQQTLQNAKLNAHQISFIEAHGTGTKIGDPIEVEAMANVYASTKSNDNPLYIASVKSNIGHTESVAGLAGMLKVILAMQNNLLPKNLHSQTLNQLINWNEYPIKVVQENTAWNVNEKYAAISGFGVTGTNAQVILSNYDSNNTNDTNLRKDIFVLPLSAKSETALINLTKKYIQFITESNIPIEEITAMTALRRAAYPIRKSFVATTKNDLLDAMQNFVDSNEVDDFKLVDEEENLKIVFVFPGQGAQFILMGKTLIQHEPVFKSALEECNTAFKNFVDWDIFEELDKTKNHRLEEIDVVQPLLVAIEIALAKLWQSKGVQPNAVIGHSMGEVAAAYIANIISLDDAAKIICYRSSLMKQASDKGAMLA